LRFASLSADGSDIVKDIGGNAKTPLAKKTNSTALSKSQNSATSKSDVSDEEVERRYQLLRSVGEECILDSDLRQLLKKKPAFRLYDGFEPSGRMHIAQGVFKALNVNKCTSAGGTFVFWVADWFGLMNDKMGGDLDKIKVVGQYFIEVWKASGMKLENVEFRWASEDIIGNAHAYWHQVLDITRSFTLQRVKKCCQIMGRAEGNLTAAQVLYPLMQCSDIFFLNADVCQLGVDQRKVNMLAREYCDLVGRKLKPVILSHHMLYGLIKGQAKMSKSNPNRLVYFKSFDMLIVTDVFTKVRYSWRTLLKM
jgi:tyrosyl-tRNA synthetase